MTYSHARNINGIIIVSLVVLENVRIFVAQKCKDYHV